MRPMIKPLSGNYIMHSPDFANPGKEHRPGEEVMSEIGEHVGLEMIGLGGLGMVLSMLKVKNSLVAANRPHGGGVSVRPSAALNPAKSFKPGA